MTTSASPAWLPAAPETPAPVPARVTMAHAARYGEWFAWATPNVKHPDLAHAAAAAATLAELGGASPQESSAAAQAAAATPAAEIPVEPSVRAFAPWYAWAKNELGLDTARAATAATAAVAAMTHGLDVNGAAAAARRAGGLTAPAAPRAGFSLTALTRDPGIMSLVWGVLCIAAPFTLHVVFIVLPVGGMLMGFRAFTRSRSLLGIAGIGLNAIAGLLTLALMFGPR